MIDKEQRFNSFIVEPKDIQSFINDLVHGRVKKEEWTVKDEYLEKYGINI